MRTRLTIGVILLLAGQQPLLPQTLGDVEVLLAKDDLTRARKVLEQLAATDPSNTEVIYRLGYVDFRQRDLVGARRHFTKIVKLAPPAVYSRYFLGRIALLEGKPLEAISWLEPVAGSAQPVLDGTSQLAKAYETTGQNAKALTNLRAAISEQPWDSALHYRLARVYQKLGQPELARDELNLCERMKAADAESVAILQQCAEEVRKNDRLAAVRLRDALLSRGNADPNTWVAAGVLLGRAGWQEEALVAFEAAARRDRTLFQAQYNYGLALLKLSRAEAAVDPLAKAASLLPQSVDANSALGLAYVLTGHHSEAVPSLTRAAQLDPANLKVQTLLALSYVRTGAAAKAVPLLRSVVASQPSDPQSYMLLAEALNSSEDPAGALAVAEEARQKFPDVPAAQMTAARQLARIGRYREAGAGFARVAALSPNDADALLGWADAEQKAGEHDKALDLYNRTLILSPELLPAVLGLARSLVSLRRLDEAEHTLEAALPRHTDDAQLHFELSRVYARLGKRELAAEQTQIVEQLKRQTP